jgi:hypothetical protein
VPVWTLVSWSWADGHGCRVVEFGVIHLLPAHRGGRGSKPHLRDVRICLKRGGQNLCSSCVSNIWMSLFCFNARVSDFSWCIRLPPVTFPLLTYFRMYTLLPFYFFVYFCCVLFDEYNVCIVLFILGQTMWQPIGDRCIADWLPLLIAIHHSLSLRALSSFLSQDTLSFGVRSKSVNRSGSREVKGMSSRLQMSWLERVLRLPNARCVGEIYKLRSIWMVVCLQRKLHFVVRYSVAYYTFLQQQLF